MAKEKFILVSLKDEESKQLAQVVTSSTARKVLDALAEKDMTASELAKTLSVPLNTIIYNLKALVKSKLVESDEYHYSSKGKEVLHYRLANKYIIIAPKTTRGIKQKLRSILPALGAVLVGSGVVGYLTRPTSPEAPLQAARTFAADGAPEAAMMVKEEAAAAVSVGAATGLPPWLWFLLGGVLALLVWLLLAGMKERST